MKAIIGFKNQANVKAGTVMDFLAEVEVDSNFDWETDIDGDVLDHAFSQLIISEGDAVRAAIQDVVIMDIVEA